MAEDWDISEALAELDVESSPEPETSKKPGGLDFLLNAAGFMTSTDLSGASPYDPLAGAARVGQFANRGNQQLAETIAEGSGRAGAAMERAGIPGGNVVAGAGVGAAGALGTASEFLMPQNRLGVAAHLLGPAAKGVQSLRKPSPKPGFVAQLGQARTKVPAGDIQQAINDPSVWKSPSVEAANAAYGAAAPGKGVTRSLGEKLGKTVLSEEDYTRSINKTGQMLKKGNLDPQSALEGVQSINRFLRNKAYTSKLDKPQLKELNELKDGLMAWMENNGAPGLRGAASTVRKAHVRENLSRIMPQNKFGGNDAMRALASSGELATAAGLALSGHPWAAVPFAAHGLTASPALWGAGIRNYQSATNPANISAFGAAINANQNRKRRK